MNIRKVTKKDIEKVAKLQAQFIHSHIKYNSELYKPKKDFSNIWKKYAIKCLTNDDKLFILVEDKEIIGYAIATVTSRAPVYKISKIGVIDAITVDVNHQQKGIASKLMENCLKWFKEKELTYIEAFVDSNNIGSLKLNTKFGLKEYQKRIFMKI